jgi:hypothetical protein
MHLEAKKGQLLISPLTGQLTGYGVNRQLSLRTIPDHNGRNVEES